MKKTIILAAAFAACSAAFSQQRHEFSLYGGGGLSTLNYSLSDGDKTVGLGGDFGLGYTFFFNEKWGITTGAGLALYNAKADLTGVKTEIQGLIDEYNERYYFRSTLKSYEEKQQTMFVNIPLMVQFQTGAKHKYYLQAGAKAGIPVSAKYKTEGVVIYNERWYPDLENSIDMPRFMGLGEFRDKNADETLKLKTVFFASVETGVKWKLKERLSLYTGIYADYGLNDIRKDQKKEFVNLNETDPELFTLNSALASKQNTSTSFTDKVSPLAVGLKLRLAFGFGKLSKTTEDEPVKPQADEPTQSLVKEKDAEVVTNNNAALQAKMDSLQKQLNDANAEIARLKAEREEYLKQAAERRKAFSQQTEVGAYGLNDVVLTEVQKKELSATVEELKANMQYKVRIVGHTCDIGTKVVNQKVGQERADVAKDYLVEQGIAPSRIKTYSKGATEPLVPNTSEENRKKNRRIEVLVTE